MWISLPCSTRKRNVAVLWFCQLVLYTLLRQQLWVTVYRELDAPSLYVLLSIYSFCVQVIYIVSGPVRFASRRVLNRYPCCLKFYKNIITSLKCHTLGNIITKNTCEWFVSPSFRFTVFGVSPNSTNFSHCKYLVAWLLHHTLFLSAMQLDHGSISFSSWLPII